MEIKNAFRKETYHGYYKEAVSKKYQMYEKGKYIGDFTAKEILALTGVQRRTILSAISDKRLVMKKWRFKKVKEEQNEQEK